MKVRRIFEDLLKHGPPVGPRIPLIPSALYGNNVTRGVDGITAMIRFTGEMCKRSSNAPVLEAEACAEVER
jgi:hypothetical protein